MSRGGLSAKTAGRQLALGWRRPCLAMREAARIGEPWRLALVILSSLIVLFANPAKDGALRVIAGQAAAGSTTGAAIGETALRGLGIIASYVFLYVVIAGILWLFTRPVAVKPSFVALRSTVAIAGWVSLLPLLAVSLFSHLLGIDMAGDVLAIGFWSAYLGLCLSETTGIDVRTSTGLAPGSTVLAFVTIVAGTVAILRDADPRQPRELHRERDAMSVTR